MFFSLYFHAIHTVYKKTSVLQGLYIIYIQIKWIIYNKNVKNTTETLCKKKKEKKPCLQCLYNRNNNGEDVFVSDMDGNDVYVDAM